MTWKRRLSRIALWAVAFAAGLYVADAMTSLRSAAAGDQAASRPTSRPALTADVQAVVDRVTTAYAKGPLSFDGQLVSDFDVAGIKEAKTLDFTGSFKNHDTFRHEAKDDLLVVANSAAVNVYDPRAKQYLSATRPSDASVASLVGAQAIQLVLQQNPALFVAITGDAREVLSPGESTAKLLADDVGSDPARVVVEATDGIVTRRTSIEKASGRIQRVDLDFAKLLESQGAAAVKRATVRIDYGEPGTTAPTADEAAYAFSPPAGATEAKLRSHAEMLAGVDASALEGKPAPAFTLKTLDGQSVSLSDLKDSVVVLDFWATWCGPCRQGLKNAAAAAAKFKDRGLKVFAVNQMEDASTVRTYVEDEKVGVPVLLDADGEASKAYLASAIPETVIIGRDGKVVKVLVGVGDGADSRLDAAVEAALGKK